MHARDEDPRVRPIPINDDGVVPLPDPDIDVQPRGPRPWVPLAIASLAIMAVVGSVSLFGALRVDEPDFDPTSFEAASDPIATTSTLPQRSSPPVTRPRLGEILPGVSDRLTLVAANDDGLASLFWNPAFRIPVAAIHEIESEYPGRELDASFDSGGRTLAVQWCTSGSCNLYLGSVGDIGLTPDLDEIGGYVWHASQVSTVAWLQPIDETRSEVVTGRVNPVSGELKDVAEVFIASTTSRLVRWDAQGFVIDEGHATSAYSPTGEPMWTLSPWHAASASDNVVVVTSREDTGWRLADRSTGELIEKDDAWVEDEDAFIWLTTSDNTDLIGRVADHGTHYSLVVSGEDITTPRSTKVDNSLRPFGFTNDARFFVFMTTDRSHITFIDWRTQETHEITVPNNYRVLSMDIG
jgi:hypothetical protein